MRISDWSSDVCSSDLSMTIPEEGLAMLEQEGMAPIAATDNGDGTWMVTIEQSREVKRYLDFPVPSEEYLFAPRTRDEDSAIYQAHRARKTLSDLIEMGFDRETVEALPTDDGDNYMDQRTEARRSDERRVGKECVNRCRSRWSQYNTTQK